MTARSVAAVVAGALLLTACAVPQRKDTTVISKVAATQAAARSVVAEYNAVRARADETLDASLLAEIEGGELLDIDRSAYFVSVRVGDPGGYPAVRLSPPERVISPRFEEYPLWFVALATNRNSGNKRVAVFERSSSVEPWLMTMAPATTAQAGLPLVARDGTGAAVTVAPQDASRTGVAPTELLRRYAGALAPGRTAEDAYFAPDAFHAQTRKFQETQQSLPFAEFEQTWSPQPSQFALRLHNGGVLVFGTLDRQDSYSVETNSYIDWNDNADSAAYLPGRVYSSAILDYSHQMLLLVPPPGQGKPRLIGQYGGVVDGQGA